MALAFRLYDQINEAEIDVKPLVSYAIGYEAREAHGRAEGIAEHPKAIIRRLMLRLDAAQVAELLGLGVEEIQRIALDGNSKAPRIPHIQRI